MKVLRTRPTRHFLFLLVKCRCGRRFGHRADRPVVACFTCGRTGNLGQVWAREVEEAPPARRRTVAAARPPARRVLRATLARRRRRAHR